MEDLETPQQLIVRLFRVDARYIDHQDFIVSNSGGLPQLLPALGRGRGELWD